MSRRWRKGLDKQSSEGICIKIHADEMDAEVFEKWFLETLLPNLDPESVIIMDNASYHSRVIDKAPTTASRKAVILQWLIDHQIPCDDKMFKPELLELVWSRLKQYVTKENTTQKLADVKVLFEKAVGEFTPSMWKADVEYVKKIVDEAWRAEGIAKAEVEQFLIPLGASESDEEDNWAEMTKMRLIRPVTSTS